MPSCNTTTLCTNMCVFIYVMYFPPFSVIHYLLRITGFKSCILFYYYTFMRSLLILFHGWWRCVPRSYLLFTFCYSNVVIYKIKNLIFVYLNFNIPWFSVSVPYSTGIRYNLNNTYNTLQCCDNPQVISTSQSTLFFRTPCGCTIMLCF